jgi:hypothetical protein
MSHRLARGMRPGCACRTGLRVLGRTPDIPAGSPQAMPRLYLAAGQCGTRVLRGTARPGWGSDERSLAVCGRTLHGTRLSGRHVDAQGCSTHDTGTHRGHDRRGNGAPSGSRVIRSASHRKCPRSGGYSSCYGPHPRDTLGPRPRSPRNRVSESGPRQFPKRWGAPRRAAPSRGQPPGAESHAVPACAVRRVVSPGRVRPSAPRPPSGCAQSNRGMFRGSVSGRLLRRPLPRGHDQKSLRDHGVSFCAHNLRRVVPPGSSPLRAAQSSTPHELLY